MRTDNTFALFLNSLNARKNSFPTQIRPWIHNFNLMNSLGLLPDVDKVSVTNVQISAETPTIWVEYSSLEKPVFRGRVPFSTTTYSSLKWCLTRLPRAGYLFTEKYESIQPEIVQGMASKLFGAEGLEPDNCEEYLRDFGYDLSERGFLADYVWNLINVQQRGTFLPT